MNFFSNNAFALRRRSVWEAADSGVLLWRTNFFYFIPFFAIPAWVLACSFRLLPYNLYYLSYILLWWLKPFFDRLVLHVISLRFFNSGASMRLRDLRRGLPGTIFRGLWGDLLWRRFSPGRGSRMPIRVLERIGRKQFKLRKKSLIHGGLNFCYLISIGCLVLEAFLLLGEILFIILMAQFFQPSAIVYMRDNMEMMEVFIFAAFCLNFILVESLYVCMGFGLYINSRVEVEGWDLQLLFQKFAGEEAQGTETINFPKHSTPEIKTVLALCLLFIRLLLPAPLSADTDESVSVESVAIEYFPEKFPIASEESLESLKEILTSPDFGSEREGWRIKYKYGQEPRVTPDIELSPWLEKLKHFFGLMLRFILALAVGASLGFSIYWFGKFRKEGRFRNLGENKGRNMYQNPLLSREKPESLYARAEELFKEGLLREAWAACLSGCLGAFTGYHSLSFPASATEYGCLALVGESLPDEKEKFACLVHNWILLAYGGRPPAPGAFEEAIAFARALSEKAPGQGRRSGAL